MELKDVITIMAAVWGAFLATYQSFNDIGSKQAASSIEQALSRFPEGEPQSDVEQRRSYIERELSAEFEKLEGTIRNESGVHFERLATYIRANADRFLRRS